ncbi:EamA family transporter [Rhizobium laguerreae]|uniref:EamA family transporter n=1 Tax=Rhizobium laguerreae TaxID=1076926 RepID=UPI0014428E70|nr:EamA family transporter [Rhizobium laguerreae]MBY3182995.1 EamA family transporter [Rhizobium laguerreae]NKM24391.1 EamA family transporter [Rhizobium laguerreae]
MRVAAILFIAVCLFLAGATASGAYVSNSNLWLLATALILYTLGNLSMIAHMRTSGLSLAISLSSVAQLIAINAIAVLVFDERLGWHQAVGVVLGIASVTLMVIG